MEKRMRNLQEVAGTYCAGPGNREYHEAQFLVGFEPGLPLFKWAHYIHLQGISE